VPDKSEVSVIKSRELKTNTLLQKNARNYDEE
jgi:hypothetical protein